MKINIYEKGDLFSVLGAVDLFHANENGTEDAFGISKNDPRAPPMTKVFKTRGERDSAFGMAHEMTKNVGWRLAWSGVPNKG